MKNWKRLAFAGVLCLAGVSVIPGGALAERNGNYIKSEAAKQVLEAPAAIRTANLVSRRMTPENRYENVAVSQVTDYVNVRTEPNTQSAILGKIYNNCAATILETVAGEDGDWYHIQSGTVTGYIKAQYFVTGEEAEALAKEVGVEYATINTSSLRLRAEPNLTSETLTMLSMGARYEVIGEENNFAKLAVDTDLTGYVSMDYIKTEVEFEQAVSLEEEARQKADEERRRQEASQAIQELNAVLQAENLSGGDSGIGEIPALTTETTSQAAESVQAASTTAPVGVNGTIAANPIGGGAGETTVGAPVKTTAAAQTSTAKASSGTVPAGPVSSEKGPGVLYGPGGNASEKVVSATRTAIVAYAKQFLGNPYVYGGTSLTDGADCSGFTMQVYKHFGIDIGRTSRDQAAKGREISQSEMQPGDLLFYASGNYINHVAMYIGGGQIIHASTPATGICLAPADYRTPCKVVTFLD